LFDRENAIKVNVDVSKGMVLGTNSKKAGTFKSIEG
jgi:hypothetical protein